MSDNAGNVNRYLISPLRRSVLWLILGPFLIMGVVMCFFPDTRLAGIVVGGIMAVFLASWHWLVCYTRLEISPQGVVLRQLGWSLEAAWDQVDHLRMDRGREGFVVNEPMGGKGVRRLASVAGFGYYGTPMYSDVQRYWIQNGQWIPVEPFMYAFRKGPMRDDIERWAPGLLAREPSGMAERISNNTNIVEDGFGDAAGPPRKPANPRLAVWIGIVVSAAVIVPLAVYDSRSGGSGRGIAFVMAFVIGPLLTLKAAASCWNSFRSGSKLLGVLFALATMVAALFEVEFFRQWLHPR
ncbi:MAG TPA: hypothetical protein VG796_03785 [Verrucomicrobiales bacterium]|jgi:hypothetical protein|nr:hypothetical protein [Verrucomicrobiales bacterium]